jgi:TonB family protein
MLIALTLAAAVILAQASTTAAEKPLSALDCRQVVANAAVPGSSSLCQAIDASRAGNAATDAEQRRQQLMRAADLFSRATNQLRDPDLKMAALDALAQIFDATHLNEPARVEQALRELVPLMPHDSSALRRIAKLQEDEGNVDGAEQTLLSARQQMPNDAAVYVELSTFYGRRAAAIEKTRPTPEHDQETQPGPGHPDAEGYYRAGESVAPPEPLDKSVAAQYPLDAQNAGIEGDVFVEITIDERGVVTDARIVKSIPALDQEALTIARRWRFAPTLVDGRPVPMKQILGVRFRTDR